MDSGDVEAITGVVCADLRKQVEFLKTQIADVVAQRDAAQESERRLWRGFAAMTGAAQYATGAVEGWMCDGAAPSTADMQSVLDDLCGQIRVAVKWSGVAVET